MENVNSLVWETILIMPPTGMRMTIFLLVFTLSIALLLPVVRSRLPLGIRIVMHGGILLFLPIAFIAEHALLSQPALISASRLRESGICLAVLDKVITYGKSVDLLAKEPGGEIRFIRIPWEIRFAQAISRASIAQQKQQRGVIIVGGPQCRPKHRETDETLSSFSELMSDGVYILEEYPEPLPPKVDIEN